MEWQGYTISCPRCGIIAETYGVSFRLENGLLAIRVDGKCHNCDLFVYLETDAEERANVLLLSHVSHGSFLASGSQAIN